MSKNYVSSKPKKRLSCVAIAVVVLLKSMVKRKLLSVLKLADEWSSCKDIYAKFVAIFGKKQGSLACIH